MNTGENSLTARGIATGFAVVAVLVLGAGPAMAYDWDTTVRDGDYRLGVDTGPTEPVADVPTSVTARITNTTALAAGTNDRCARVVGEAVTVVVTGPDGYRDRFEVEIPADEPFFEFSYVFPTSGAYEIELRATVRGEDLTFRFTRSVASPSVRSNSDRATRTNSAGDGDSLADSVLLLGVLSGGAALFAFAAFVAAVLAYRGTD